jgi:diguanylate cyclase (GGDEF)-like protein
MSTDNTKKNLRSLRTRYLLLIAVLAIVTFLGGVLGQRNLTQSSSESAAQLQARNHVLEYSRGMRVGLFESYKSLNALLLDPTRKEHRPRIYEFLNLAILDSESLLTDPWIAQHGQRATVQHLKDASIALGIDINKLIETRLDPTRQYPSLEVGNTQMQPNRDLFNNTIALAVGESGQPPEGGVDMTVLHHLLQVRHLWTQMLSNFRLYLANRVGSFNESALPAQENAVDTMYQVLVQRLQELSDLDAQGKLGFQTSAAVDDMTHALAGWYGGFVKVKEIHHSDNWRADIKFIKTHIEPNLNRIGSLLNKLEQSIADASGNDQANLTHAIAVQTHMAWIIGGLGLLLVVAIVLSLNLLVFRPIQLVSEGLKAEAFGREGTPLPQARSQETQDLIDAFSEMRKQVHQRQADLQHQATHDSLTDLPNRTLLQDRMEQAIHLALRQQSRFAFLMMDLDRFKDINDTLGHHVGDLLLTEIGQRLRHTLREADTIARLGGDEFAILLLDSDQHSAEQVAQKIIAALVQPFEIDELHLYVGGSIGIACFPEQGTDVATLIQRADVAMYVAKSDHRNYALYSPQQDNYSIGRLALMADLRQALQHDALSLHYQPKLNLDNGEVIGVEALLRWDHPEYGVIPPEQVVQLAEHTGLIGPLTYWVLERAVTTAAAWRAKGRALNMAVNLSVHNLRDQQFQTRVAECLAAHQLPPQALTLEITEHAMMANPMEATQILHALDAMGVQLAVDDYGTGFSSLAYLKQLPVDELKIDKSFVMRMHENPNDEIIVRSTVDLAHNLGLRVVAEGVEDAATWNSLREFGCDYAQGYHMSRPLPLGELDAWLETH